MRLYHLARELRVSIRTLLREADASDIGITSHMSSIDGEEADILRERIGTNGDVAEDVLTTTVVETEVATAVEEAPPVEEAAPPAPEVVEPEEVAPAPPPEPAPAPEAKTAPPPAEPTEELPAATPGRKPKKGRDKVRRQIQEELADTRTPDAEAEAAPPKPAELPPKRKIQKKVVRIVRRRERGRTARGPAVPAEVSGKRVEVTPPVSVKDFSQALGIKANMLIKKLMENGVFARINAMLDEETIQFLALEFGREVVLRREKDLERDLQEDLAADSGAEEDQVDRAPIVTFLGHVDHGKTSLMDSIRETSVAAGEAGGITQHIGAYKVETDEGGTVVFLDTPGHEAFTSMRARGANVTDMVVLVVAADDGVMPQTEEAINHARAAEVPILVALNKIDRPDADSMRVKQQLSNHGLVPEDWGGDTIMIETSAVTGQGIKELLEYLTLQAEMLELKANPALKARGTVIEAQLTEGRGVVANLLIQDGTLHRGDVIVCGRGEGKARAIRNDRDELLDEAGPSTPIAVTGLSEVPEAGDKFYVLDDASRAKALAETRQRRAREKALAERQHVTLENLFDRMKSGQTEEVRLILKADVKGSVEAIREKLESLGTEEVKVKLLHVAVGGVNESDVILADASDAIILGFQVVPEERARNLASEKGIEIRQYQVIYELIGDVREAMEKRLAPDRRESILGHAEVRALFKVSRMGTIAGCYVRDGVIRRNAHIRISRDGKVILNDASLASLKRFKDDTREVRDGLECGLRIDGFDDVKEGDVIEAYEFEEVKRTLEDSRAANDS
jgi:translation initiation factor IF-2